MAKHFIRISGKILGPFEMDQLRSLKARGRLQADHDVSPDRRTWQPASSLTELFGEAVASRQILLETPPQDPELSAKSIEWFYVIDDEQRGPTSFKHLKNLVAQGELTAKDLIWHSGLDEWIPVRDQPGLSSSLRSKKGSQTSASGKRDSEKTESQTFLWSQLLQLLKEEITTPQLRHFFNTLSSLGGLSLLLAMVLSLIAFATIAIKLNSVPMLLAGLGVVLMISVMRYIGLHSIQAGDRLIATTPNQISSRAPANIVSVMLLSTGVLLFSGLIYLGIHADQFNERTTVFIAATQILCVFVITACVLLQTDWMNIEIVSNSRAGHEGIAILSFVLKLLMRFCSITFGICSILAAVGFGIACFLVFTSDDILTSSHDILECGRLGVYQTFIAGLAPWGAYLALAVGSILLDVCQSLMQLKSTEVAAAPAGSGGRFGDE